MSGLPQVLISRQGRLGFYADALAQRARRELGRLAGRVGLDERCELSLLLCDNPTMRRLNRRWRDIDRPTDVLSFPQQSLNVGDTPEPGPLGDIVVSLPTMRRDARRNGVAPEAHLSRLLAHGLLHLLGHDHARPTETRRMRACERELLGEGAYRG